MYCLIPRCLCFLQFFFSCNWYLSLIVLWSEKMLDTISIFLNLLRSYLWTRIWSILENVPCALEKKVYSSAFGWDVLKISMRSISYNVSFKTCVSILIFCFDDLSIDVTGVLKSPTITVLLSISPFISVQFRSVQFSHSVVSDSLQHHGLKYTRPSCPWLTPKVYPNSSTLSQWRLAAISSSVVPFSSCPQSFPASGSFQMSQLFKSGDQVLEFQLQHQSFQWTLRTDLL